MNGYQESPMLEDAQPVSPITSTGQKRKNQVTYQRVRHLFDYVNGQLVRKIYKKGSVFGYRSSGGYLRGMIDGQCYMVHRIIWLWHNGYHPETEIDHINRNPSDNKIENLRVVSRQCNKRNAGIRKDNKTGVKGVSFTEKRKVWRAKIRLNGKSAFLGDFKDFTEAVYHRYAAEQCLGWHGCEFDSSAFKYLKSINGIL